MYQRVVEIIKAHYVPGLTTYRGVWREFVFPVYPMTYTKMMRIVGYENLQGEIATVLQGWDGAELPGVVDMHVEAVAQQLSLLDIPGVGLSEEG